MRERSKFIIVTAMIYEKEREKKKKLFRLHQNPYNLGLTRPDEQFFWVLMNLGCMHIFLYICMHMQWSMNCMLFFLSFFFFQLLTTENMSWLK